MTGEVTYIKHCSKCNRFKNLHTDFYCNKTTKDGYQSICKECSNASATKWQREHRDRTREIGKASYHRRSDSRKRKYREYRRKYREKNAVRISVSIARWQSHNMDKLRKIQRNWITNKYNNDVIFKLAHLIRCRVGKAYVYYATEGKYRRDPKGEIDYEAIINHMGPIPDGYHYGHPQNNRSITIDHIVPLRLLDLTDPLEYKIAVHYLNHRWLPHLQNYRRGKEWDDEARAMYIKIKEMIENDEESK